MRWRSACQPKKSRLSCLFASMSIAWAGFSAPLTISGREQRRVRCVPFIPKAQLRRSDRCRNTRRIGGNVVPGSPLFLISGGPGATALEIKVDFGPVLSPHRISETFGGLAISASVLFHNSRKNDPRIFVGDQVSGIGGWSCNSGSGFHDPLYLQRDFRRSLLRSDL